jgi:hypothetical protein
MLSKSSNQWWLYLPYARQITLLSIQLAQQNLNQARWEFFVHVFQGFLEPILLLCLEDITSHLDTWRRIKPQSFVLFHMHL